MQESVGYEAHQISHKYLILELRTRIVCFSLHGNFEQELDLLVSVEDGAEPFTEWPQRASFFLRRGQCNDCFNDFLIVHQHLLHEM
jgi:hypothetical protein